MNKRVTQRDIARHVGVSLTTVCLALREDKRISAAVRERVGETAKALGYLRDPMLSSLSVYRHKCKSERVPHQRIAYLCPEEFQTEDQNKILRGIRERANTLGYGLDDFYWDRSPETLERHLKVCRARGIRGIIAQTRGKSLSDWPVDLGGFAVVLVGGAPADRYRQVAPAYFENARRATLLLQNAGYRRIGLLLPGRGTPAHIAERYQAGYLTANRIESMNGNPDRASDVIGRISRSKRWREAETWIRAQRLDAVLIGGTGESLLDELAAFAEKQSRAFGYAILDKKQASATVVSGMHIMRSRIGGEAADTLDLFLTRHSPAHPADYGGTLLVHGEWDAGTTA